MPNYDYRCLDCKKRFVIYLSYEEYGIKPVVCPYCMRNNVQRRIGRVRVTRSDENRLTSIADPSSLEGIDEDPRALGRMMRQMSSEIGEDMGPEFNEVVGRLEAGQDPEQIEKDLPDLGSTDSNISGGDDIDDY